MQNAPTLYSFRRCPYAMRARLALAISGICVELREVKLSAKPAEMLAASPKATVPVLVLADGQVIDQSLEIMHYVLSKHDPDAWLEHYDADLVARNDGPFKQDLDRYKYPDRYGLDPTEYRANGVDFLQDLEQRLVHAPYISGLRLGLTDAAILPFIRQFSAVDTQWFESLALPHVQRWLAEFLGSVLFAAVMCRLSPWMQGDEPYYPAWAER